MLYNVLKLEQDKGGRETTLWGEVSSGMVLIEINEVNPAIISVVDEICQLELEIDIMLANK